MADKSSSRMRGYPSIDGAEDMARRLQESLRGVEENAFHMNRSIDQGNFEESLKFAVKMLRELRVGSLSPRSYYELWMKIFDHLRQLHSYFLEVNEKGLMSMADMYQKVQGTNHIIPRLYLMVTVGSAFILRQEAPSKDVLQDLIEMTKGVQHPLRGLFLRNYLLKMTQDKLSEELQVDTDFVISFILQNLSEMNRLWVRMQHQGNAKNRTRREKERQELKVLISFNLVRLSEGEGITLELYQSSLLDKILDIVISCKDRIAQQYLIDVLIQVFPTQFHLTTLQKLLGSFEHLEPEVDLKSILISLMDRIKFDQDEEESDAEAEEATEAEEESDDNKIEKKGEEKVSAEAFERINECIDQTMSRRKGMTVEDILDLQIALLDFAVTCYPGQLTYIDQVLGFCAKYLEDSVEKQQAEGTSSVVDVLVLQLLKVPLKQKELGSIDLLKLSYYPALMSRLSWTSKKKVAHGFLQHVLGEKDLVLDSEEVISKLLEFIAPLIKDDDDSSEDGEARGEGEDPATFVEQQQSVAKLVNRFGSDDPAMLFRILGVARKHFGKGGIKRIRYTLPPLLFRFLMLADTLHQPPTEQKADSEEQPKNTDDDEQQHNEKEEQEEDTMQKMLREQKSGGVSLRKVFQYVHEIASALAGVVELQDLALRLFLQAAMSSGRAGEQEVAYEFMAQAFTLYEDVADTKEQLRTLPLLIGTVQKSTVFDKESYETLATKTTQYAARLLKKTDQCKMVLRCSHLFWSVEPKRELRQGEEGPAPGQDGKRALECLQKALKIADSCVASSLHVSLFVEILNRYVHFFVNGMDKISAQNVNDLLALIKGNLADMHGEDEEKASMETFLANTTAHLKTLKSKHPDDDKYAALDV